LKRAKARAPGYAYSLLKWRMDLEAAIFRSTLKVPGRTSVV